MPRRPRIAPGGYPQHVLNRAAGKIKLLHSQKDFAAFENLLVEAHERYPIRILAYCLLGSHWHFVVWPEHDHQVTAFFRWLTHTHAMRCRTSHRTVGYGPLYQGRFKSFVVQRDEHLLAVGRYVERNALTAGLVKRAQDWRWGSLYVRENGADGALDAVRAILSPWPVEGPADWPERVNQPLGAKEKDRMQLTIRRSRPFGDETWVARTARKLELKHTLRREGRPSAKGKGVAGGKRMRSLMQNKLATSLFHPPINVQNQTPWNEIPSKRHNSRVLAQAQCFGLTLDCHLLIGHPFPSLLIEHLLRICGKIRSTLCGITPKGPSTLELRTLAQPIPNRLAFRS